MTNKISIQAMMFVQAPLTSALQKLAHNHHYLAVRYVFCAGCLLSPLSHAERFIVTNPPNAQAVDEVVQKKEQYIPLEQIEATQQSANPLASDGQNQNLEKNPIQEKNQSATQDLQQRPLEPFDPNAVYQLKDSDIPPLDRAVTDQVMRLAQQAQQQAKAEAATLPSVSQIIIRQQNEQLPADPPIPTTTANSQQVKQLLGELQSQRVDLNTQFIAAQTGGYDPSDPKSNLNTGEEKRSWFARILHRKDEPEPVPKIRVTALGGTTLLNDNVRGKLSNFTVEGIQDFNAAVPQLRAMAVQAAQAVGYYQAEFRFAKTADNAVTVTITPHEPVTVHSQHIEISGDGATKPAFKVIQVVPDLNVDDILNHRLYETTKSRITTAASSLGYFDSYWRMHDVKVSLPQNIADIMLKYETGERYKFKAVEYRMSDPQKPFPLRRDILEKLVPFAGGDDYSSWRVNTLTSNLIDTRYFNSAAVNVIKPDPIRPPLELPDDIKDLLSKKQQQELREQNQPPSGGQTVSQQRIVNEQVFAGSTANPENQNEVEDVNRTPEQIENDRLRIEARQTKTIPVIVTLNADQLNNLEAGIGYGTDTGVRLRSQYRRSIVNDRGHTFDANLEVSKIRQAFDGRYMIPYKDPINDYINLIGGYEREQRNNIGQGVQLQVESAVFGAERAIKKPLGEWQQTYSLRYRLDRINGKDTLNTANLPDAFRVISDNPQQQSLLVGYQISRTTQNNRIEPTQGLRQFYGIQLGSKNLLSEADMAILNAGWRFIYSFGDNAKHQAVGRGDVGYIASDDFNHVPYNLRYFAGGDQSLRGFDYKSLSPKEDNVLLGGQILAVGSLEYNYLFRPKWRGAVFVDVGNAYDKDLSNPTAYGVGVGVRWSSPIGPIRFDVAAGVSEKQIPIRLHFFIGPPL